MPAQNRDPTALLLDKTGSHYLHTTSDRSEVQTRGHADRHRRQRCFSSAWLAHAPSPVDSAYHLKPQRSPWPSRPAKQPNRPMSDHSSAPKGDDLFLRPLIALKLERGSPSDGHCL